MNKTLILIASILIVFSIHAKAQSNLVNCNNLFLDTNNFILSYQQDTVVSGNINYLDTNMTVYPFMHLILSDTSIITSSDVMILSFMAYPFDTLEAFNFNIHFKSGAFTNGTIVNGFFHYFDSDVPGDSSATCYLPITLILQNTTEVSEINAGENSVKIFPNPFSELTTFIFEKDVINASITIYNSQGSQVNLLENISGKQFSISAGNLKKGFYFYEIRERSRFLNSGKLSITE